MVKATMNGHKELLSVAIDKEAVDPNDVDMLQDLVVAAVNEASRKVDEAMQNQLGAMTGGLKSCSASDWQSADAWRRPDDQCGRDLGGH